MKPIKLTEAQMDDCLRLKSAPADFEGGADELRRIVKVMGDVAEWVNDCYTIAELIRLYQAHKACEWDYYPDQWSQEQRDAAAKYGTVPKFDDNGRPLTHVEKTLLGALK